MHQESIDYKLILSAAENVVDFRAMEMVTDSMLPDTVSIPFEKRLKNVPFKVAKGFANVAITNHK